MSDIINFSKNEETHYRNLDLIFQTLYTANMKCQLDKCDFFNSNVDFLGFVITFKGIETNSVKVKAIANYHVPRL